VCKLTFQLQATHQKMSASNRAAMLRTTFLQDAAKSIAIASPSTASYLVSESFQQELASGPQNKALPDHQRQSFCTACGNVFIPGRNCSEVRGERTAAGQSKKGNVQRRTIVYNCQACYQRTTLSLPPSPQTANSKGQEKGAPHSPILGLDTKHQSLSNPAAPPTKTSSKKRAKARKEKAGLQSMLAKSREARSSPQLNLMDLMMP
jgi:RNase P subunit RPR2